jgi:carbon monoxide dehydrogenase subunit G
MAMEFSGEYRIPSSCQQVWEALNDPAVLQACIPGCRQLDKVSDTEFAATVVSKVGPISATFRGNVMLSDLDPPNGYTLTGRGQGGAAGFARMSAAVTLRPDGEATALRYLATAEIGGKLASVGSRLVQTVAAKNADDFFTAFARRFGGDVVDGAAAQATAATATATASAAARLPAHVRDTSYNAVQATSGSTLAALVPAWLVIFVSLISFALGYFIAR